MIGLVSRWAELAPDRFAVIAGGDAITYATLGARVRDAMRELRVEGVREGDRVPLIAAHGLATIVRAAAVMELGATLVPIHARLTTDERARVVASVVIDGDRRSDATSSTASRDDDERDLAIVFTSGSTGAPRGVRLSRRAFRASARANAENLGWRDHDRWLLVMTIAHVGGLSVLVRSWIAGTCVVVPELPDAGGVVAAAGLVARSIERDRVTLASLVPTMLGATIDAMGGRRASSTLRAVLVGGARASQPLVERACALGWPVLRTYGMTEACSQVATQPITDAGRAIDDCGPSLPGIEVRVRDDDGAIGLRGDVLASGIAGDDCVMTDPDGWLWTGDVGAIDEQRRLRVLGRRTEMIVTGGENVWPAEVERAIESWPGVESARVIGLEDPQWGEIVGAVVAVSDARIDARWLAAMARERLASHRRPRRWVVVRQMPMGSAGKIDNLRVREWLGTRGVTP